MRRRVVLGSMVAVVLVSLSVTAAWDVTALSSYSTMENVNALLVGLGDEAGVAAPSLHVGYGVRAEYEFDLEGAIPPLYVGASGLLASTKMRDLSASVNLMGVTCGIERAAGPWRLSAGLGAYRGAMELPAARMVGLTGWGLGLEVGGGYLFSLSTTLGVALQIRAQWLPIDEMVDPRGQPYRGRGTAFVDFSGLVASIGFNWAP